MKKLLFIMAAFICCACADNTDYKALYDGHVKELSNPKHFGRTDYNGGVTAAADYLRSQIAAMGLESKDLHFTYNKNTIRGQVEFAVDGKPYVFCEDFVVKEFSTGKDATMNIYYLPEKYLQTKEDFQKHLGSGKFKDKFVAFDFALYKKNFGTTGVELTEGIEIYKDNLTQLAGKVGGIIFMNAERPVNFISRATYTIDFPVISVGPNFPKDAKKATVKMENEFLEGYKGVNIATLVEGKNKSAEHIIMLAHYDHLGVIGGEIFAGANDNASGVAAHLALMQYYKNHQPDRSLLFLFVDGEEANLLGAKAYVENPYLPLENVKFLINLDMVGDNGNNIFCEVGGGEAGEKGLELFNKINAEKGYFTSVDVRPFCDNSDHYYFGMAGVPCMYFTIEGDKYQYYHTPKDTYENFTSEKFEPLFGLMTDFIKEF